MTGEKLYITGERLSDRAAGAAPFDFSWFGAASGHPVRLGFHAERGENFQDLRGLWAVFHFFGNHS